VTWWNASQGVERQTLSELLYLWRWRTIWRSFRVLNNDRPARRDQPDQRGDRSDHRLDTSNAIACSAKTGLGVAPILQAVVDRVAAARRIGFSSR